MDVRDALLQLFRWKQIIDQGPAHEAKATYLLLCAFILVVFYTISKPFHLYLAVAWSKIVDSVDLSDIGSVSDEDSTPGEFPGGQSTIFWKEDHDCQPADQDPPVCRSPSSDSFDEVDARDQLVHLVDQLRKQVTQQKDKVKHTNEQLRCHLKAARGEVESLNIQLETAKGRIRQYEKTPKKEYKSSSVQTLPLAEPSKEKEIQMRKRLVHTIRKLEEEHKAETERSKADVLRLESELSQCKECIKAREEHMAKLQVEKQAAEEAQTNIKKTVDAEKKAADEALGRSDTRILELEQQNASKDACITNLTAEKLQAATASDSVVQKIETLNRVIADLTDRNLELEVDKEAQEEEIEKLLLEKKAADDVKEESRRLNNERNAIRAELEHAKARMQQEIDILRNGNSDVHSNNRRLQLKHENTVFELSKIQQHNEQLQAQVEALRTDSQSRQKYEQEIKHLKGVVEQINAQLAQAKRLHEAPGADLQRAVTNLQSEVQKERIERARAQKRFDDGLTRVVNAEKKVAQLEREKREIVERQTQTRNPQAGTISLRDLQTRLAEQADKLNKSHGETVQTLEAQLSRRQIVSDTQRAEISVLTEVVEKLRAERETLEWGMNHQQEEKHKRDQAIEQLEIQVQQGNSHVEGLTSAFKTTREEMEREIGELQAIIAELQKSQTTAEKREANSSRGGHKRNLDSHFGDDEDDEEASRGDTAAPSVVRAVAAGEETTNPSSTSINHLNPATGPARSIKRTASVNHDKSTLDYDLFDGPEPDLEEQIRQDEENARREKAEAELVAELQREMGYGE